MKAVIVALALSSAAAFQAATPVTRPATHLQAYVPSGMTPEEWEKIKAKECAAAYDKKLAADYIKMVNDKEEARRQEYRDRKARIKAKCDAMGDTYKKLADDAAADPMTAALAAATVHAGAKKLSLLSDSVQDMLDRIEERKRAEALNERQRLDERQRRVREGLPADAIDADALGSGPRSDRLWVDKYSPKRFNELLGCTIR